MKVLFTYDRSLFFVMAWYGYLILRNSSAVACGSASDLSNAAGPKSDPITKQEKC